MTPETPSSNRALRVSWALAAGLAVVTFLVFAGSLRGEFVLWDDPINITDNEHLRGLNKENFRWMFFEIAYARRYMPLAWLGWTINYQVTGLQPAAFHGGNLLFHCANTVLVFLLLRRLLSNLPNSVSAHGIAICAALGALLWGVHPLRVEAVAWASARIYDQAFFFAFVSVLCYLQFAGSAESTRRRWIFFWLSVAAYAASLLTYPVALTLGVVPLLLDFHPLRRLPQSPAPWRNPAMLRILAEKIPFLMLLASVLALTLWGRVHAEGNFEAPATLDEFGPLARLMQAFYVWAYYVWKPWLPLHLSPHYNALISFQPLDARFLASAALVLGLTLAAFALRRRWPGLLVAWLGHVILLVPLLGLTEKVYVTGDRYSYGIAALWSLLIAASLVHTWARRAPRMAGIAASLLIAGILATASARQIRVWQNSESLYRHTIACAGDGPYSEYLHSRLAHALFQRGKLPEALAEYSTAVRLNPALPEAHEGLGLVFGATGRSADAIAHYRSALANSPNRINSLNNLAWILATHPDPNLRQGNEAVALAERACALTRYRKPILIGTLAAAYAEAGRFPEAIVAAHNAETLAAEAGDLQTAARNRELLNLYRAQQPFRERP